MPQWKPLSTPVKEQKSDERTRSFDNNKLHLLGSSLKKEADETLFLELALRGYDLSKLRDEEATGEVVKIG